MLGKKEKKKKEKRKEQKTLSGCRVINFTGMVHLTQVHKVKESVSVSFFKYGKQKPYTNHLQWTKLPSTFFEYESKYLLLNIIH